MKETFRLAIEAEDNPIFQGLFSALNSEPVVSIRFNRHKTSTNQSSLLTELGEKVPWEEAGYYLPTRPSFTLDPLFHQGMYYVQDASSMILGEIARRLSAQTRHRPLFVLDSCAAPGGKTTAVTDNLPQGSAMIANEYDFRRAEILKENIYKWGCANVAVSRGDTRQFQNMAEVFDIIIADLPCSGEGMFRKDKVAREQWSEQLVNQCADIQKVIIGNLIPSLKKGGYLIYSTCTFNSHENEKNVAFLCEKYGLKTVDMELAGLYGIEKGIIDGLHCLRFLPSRLKGEGLFVSVLTTEAPSSTDVYSQISNRPVSRQNGDYNNTLNAIDGWTKNLTIRKVGNILWGMTPALNTLIRLAEAKKIHLYTYGTEIAQLKGSDVVPSHSLALSQSLNINAFPHIDIDKDTALNFLRKGNITLPDVTPTGYVLICYNNAPLGFVKNIGKRANNLLPKEWKIRI